MRKKLVQFSLVVAAALLSSTVIAKPVAYTIDTTHTQVDFRWNHLGLSSPSASADAVGTVMWDAQEPSNSSVLVSMPVSSIRTRVQALDADFQSDKFFAAAQHPTITFRSTSVERVGLGNKLRIHGELTVRGITRPVVLSGVFNGEAPHPMYKASAIGFDATTTIKRSEFGLTVALPMVSDEVEVRITLEGLEANAAEKALRSH